MHASSHQTAKKATTMIPTIDVTKGAVLTMNVVDDDGCDDDEDIDDEMAEDQNEPDDDFWLGKLGDFLKPCRPVYKAEEKPEKPPEVKKESPAAPAPVVQVEDEDEVKIVIVENTGKRRQGTRTNKAAAATAQRCPLCAVSFQELNKHIKEKHGVEGVVCPHCSKILAKNCTLSRHIEQVHFNLQIHKPAKCGQCDKVFSKKGHLDRHVKTIHMGMKEESNPCPHCGKIFSTKSSLEPHIMMVHQGIRKKCPECGKVLSDLWKHMRTMHGKYRRRAKISRQEAIDLNIVPSFAGKIDVSDVHVAKTVPTFTNGDLPQKIEYVKVSAFNNVKEGFSLLKQSRRQRTPPPPDTTTFKAPTPPPRSRRIAAAKGQQAIL